MVGTRLLRSGLCLDQIDGPVKLEAAIDLFSDRPDGSLRREAEGHRIGRVRQGGHNRINARFGTSA